MTCGAEKYGGHLYYFCIDPLYWLDAQMQCVQLGGDLVTVDNQSENQWLSKMLNSYSGDKWWMGFNDLQQEGKWQWVDGSPVGYTNWEPGEPNDTGGEDCGQLNRFYPSDTWNDEPCDQGLPFVCEII